MRGHQLAEARASTDALFDLVTPGSFYEQPIPERHRIIFYLGHLEAFDWNLLREPLNLTCFHPTFDRLFAFGIDPKEGSEPSDKPSDWPSVAEVRDYNRRVRETLDPLLDAAPPQLFDVALEHRLMHAETFAYILHSLPYAAKRGQEHAAAAGTPPRPEMIEIPAGPARMGREPSEGFGWDNEFDAHTVFVPAFAIGRYKVTNGEYLEFVAAGAAPPHFWVRHRSQWLYRGMFAEIPLPLDWPVYVTHAEATAYAAWRGMRLPTEAEFQRAAYDSGPAAAGNYDFRRWDPAPVHAGRRNAFGAVEMVGNGWEWTASVFRPFPGFRPFPFYPGYSANFFDGEHYVLKGASPRTAARLARPSFRNWFRGSYPYVYATFRLAGG
jgi:formylglycine-generating enzyme required for sulfatase activity